MGLFGRPEAPAFCCAARFLAAFAAFNHDYPVALHGAGRTADEADDTIGSAAAARTRQLTRYNDLMPFECTVKAQASSDHDSFR